MKANAVGIHDNKPKRQKQVVITEMKACKSEGPRGWRSKLINSLEGKCENRERERHLGRTFWKND